MNFELERVLLLVVFIVNGEKLCSNDASNPIKVIAYNKSDPLSENILHADNVTRVNDVSAGFSKIAVSNLCVTKLNEGDVGELRELETLLLDSNGLEEISPGSFDGLSLIKRISLERNNIKEIKGGVFSNLNLYFLLLSNNRIEFIEANAFDNMTEILAIMLGNNKIKEINPDWFSNCDKLFTVSLEGNEITEIPAHAFKNLNCVHNVSNKIIRSNVYMGRNKISKIHPLAFRNITEIGYIWLQDNLLSELENDLFSGFSFISTLRLNRNRLTCLSDEILKDLRCARFVNIGENPWTPHCLHKIQMWAQENNIIL